MLLFNLHLHSAIADGVFLQKSANERPEFRALPAPEKGDVIALAWEVCEKTTRMLQKAGKYFDADPSEADKLAQEYPLLAACCADSLQGTMERTATSSRCGPSTTGSTCTQACASRRATKRGRERMMRYILRPPIATKRLTLGKDGRVICWLREAWADGSKCFTFEPLDFIAKLLPLVPPPRVNMTRYFGA